MVSAKPLLRWASRLGPHAAAGIILLIVSVAIYYWAIAPTRASIASLEAQLARFPQSVRLPARSDAATAPLADFYAFFPRVRALPESLANVYALAERQGLDVAAGEYRMISAGSAQLEGYQVTFPLRGTYLQLRAFILDVLNDLPYVAVDDLRLEKHRAEDTMIDANIKLTFYMRFN